MGNKSNRNGRSARRIQGAVGPVMPRADERSAHHADQASNDTCWIWFSLAVLVISVGVLVTVTIASSDLKYLVTILAVVPTLVAFCLIYWFKGGAASWRLLLEMFWIGFLGAIPIAFTEVLVQHFIVD